MFRGSIVGLCAVLTLALPDDGGARLQETRGIRELTTDLGAVDPVVRARAACGLRDLGERAAEVMPALIKMLADASPVDGTVCARRWGGGPNDLSSPGEQAAAALVAIGSQSFQPLLAALKQDAWVARRNAAWALGTLDNAQATSALVEALRDREPPVREQAAWALGAIDDRAAVQPLIRALGDAAPAVRKQAAWALGAIDDSAAVDSLVRALADQQAEVREQAAWALGAIGDSNALPGLMTALKDSSAGVRRQAAWAIGAIGR